MNADFSLHSFIGGVTLTHNKLLIFNYLLSSPRGKLVLVSDTFIASPSYFNFNPLARHHRTLKSLRQLAIDRFKENEPGLNCSDSMSFTHPGNQPRLFVYRFRKIHPAIFRYLRISDSATRFYEKNNRHFSLHLPQQPATPVFHSLFAGYRVRLRHPFL